MVQSSNSIAGNEWLVSFFYYKITVIFVTDGIGNLMSGLLGNIFDVDYDDDTLTTSEPLRTPSIQVHRMFITMQ